jgi:large subunit ribosomal protein L32
MAEPKKRKSHSKARLKRTHQNFRLPNLIKCPHCKELIPQNLACPNCGYFKNKKAIEIKEKIKTKVKEKET